MTGMQMFLVGFGVLLLAGGVLMAIQRLRAVLFGVSADGIVVGQSTSAVSDRDGRMANVHAPIVEFSHGGSNVRFTSTLGTQKALPNGTRLTVRYLPGDPAGTAEIATGLRTWGFPIVAIAGGALLIVLGR